MASAYIIIPGLHNSDAQHWQSRWEREFKGFYRVKQKNWDKPVCADWVAELQNAVAKHKSKDIYLVAHSLGCLTAVHWAQRFKKSIKGALLVAPPNANSHLLQGSASGFSPVPLQRLPFDSILVASSNDPYCSVYTSYHYAQAWGSRFVNLGYRGHINASSELGLWPEGLELLDTFVYKDQLITI